MLVFEKDLKLALLSICASLVFLLAVVTTAVNAEKYTRTASYHDQVLVRW